MTFTNSTSDLGCHRRSSAKSHKKLPAIIPPTQYIDERDDIETNNDDTRSRRSCFEQRQVLVKGNRMKVKGHLWYLTYGIVAVCIFVGSFVATFSFFKVQLIHRNKIERCQNGDQRCYKLSSEELLSLHRQAQEGTPPDADSVGIVSTSDAALSDLLPWIDYHRMIGVQKFYIFCTHPEEQFNQLLSAIRDPKNHLHGWNYDDVDLIPVRNKMLEPIKDLQSAAAYASNPDRFYASRFGRTPEDFWLFYEKRNVCGDHFLTFQALNADEGMELALRDGIDWLAHIDSDEFLFSGHTMNVHIGKILRKVDKKIGSLKIQNWESVPEMDEASNKFHDITLFNKDKTSFRAYNNGKSFGRVAETTLAYDAHSFTQKGNSALEDVRDYLNQIVVLHYAHSSFKTIMSRAQRDNKCKNQDFLLPFDHAVYDGAKMWKNDENSFLAWYHDMVVLGDDKEEMKRQKLEVGNMTRVEIPSDILNYLASHGTREE